ncbi:MAG: hypothetical protein D6730_15465, partial [Bacteroidetes bacterium]
QRTGFLAKSTIFANRLISWLLKQLHVIPVYRREDVQPGQRTNNLGSFRACIQYLSKGGTLLIFPEGTSFAEMKLRPLKSGLARIALETEARHDFGLGLPILPVALNYLAPNEFRSPVIINIGPPIWVKDWEVVYKNNPQACVKQLTAHLQEQMEALLIIADDKEQENLLKQLTQLINGAGPADFEQQQQLANTLRQMARQQPDVYEALREKTLLYTRIKQRLKVSEKAFEKAPWQRPLGMLAQGLYLLLTLPLFLLGVLTHYLPYTLPAHLARRLTDEIEYHAAIMMVSGMLLFPAFYVLEICLFHHFLSPGRWFTLAFGLSLPLLGIFSLYYGQHWMDLRQQFKLWLIYLRKKELLQKLAQQQADILSLLQAPSPSGG